MSERPSPIADLFPGAFALVMATGIIAVGAALEGLDRLAEVLYAVAVVAHVVLAAMLLARLARFRSRLAADLTAHARGFAFLTVVAATNVVASASIVVHGWWALAEALWWASLVLWAVLVYIPLVAVVIDRVKPGLEGGINGSWFLLTVATQSVAVVAGLLLTSDEVGHRDLLAFVGVAAFALGIVLYLIVMTMVFLRWTFHPLEPDEADPPAWIAAGAVAITVLAGSNLLLAVAAGSQPGEGADRLLRLAGFLEGMVVLAWATATFWFPLMVAIGVWRHVVRRVPLHYHPSYWSMVFPLGMYGVATSRMRQAIDLDALAWLPEVQLAIALTAWTVTFAGLLLHLTARWRRPA